MSPHGTYSKSNNERENTDKKNSPVCGEGGGVSRRLAETRRKEPAEGGAVSARWQQGCAEEGGGLR